MANLVRGLLPVRLGFSKDPINGNNHNSNPLTMSDEYILQQIYSTHVHSHTATKFDAESLFNIAAVILGRSTYVAENVVQRRQPNKELYSLQAPAGFTSPLCTLKQINSLMSCKQAGEEIAFETTLAILQKLTDYSWTAKGVLTLSAFAIEYGEFWMLSQDQPTEPLSKSLAILKRVPQLTNSKSLEKHHNAILELNNLIKETLKVIGTIIELERLCAFHGINVVPFEQLPVDVFWVIITIVAIVTQIECLTTDSDSRQNLSQFGQKINIIINKWRNYESQIKILIEYAEYEKTLDGIFRTPTEIMEAFKVLIFWKVAPKECIYDGVTETLVNIDELKTKDVFLLITTLDISQEDIISMLTPIYERLKKEENQYKIVWIPIVDQWNDESRKTFHSIKSKMPWYVLHHFETIKGIKYIKEKWNFNQKPLLIVLDPKSTIQHYNAFHMIQIWGVKGFPFTKAKETELTKELKWVDSLFIPIGINIKWDAEEKFAIVYGGKKPEWIKEFSQSALALVNHATIKQTNTLIELFCLADQKPIVVSKFWNNVEKLFMMKMDDRKNIVTQQVEKLLSYKDEDGWAIVIKGSIVAFVGHGKTILTTFKESGKWIGGIGKKGFVDALKDHYNIVLKTVHVCSHFEIHNPAGKVPEFFECQDCHRKMEMVITYKCCHKDEDESIINGEQLLINMVKESI